MKRRLMMSLAVLASALLLGGLLVWLLVWHFASSADEAQRFPAAPPASAAQIARGAYLARAGDCVACHTERGGLPYAGGRVLATPFGEIVAPNITPDKATGLGQWQADDFWRALHHGKSRDGRMLYPAFPYPNYTKVSREDSDAMFAFLQSLPAVANKTQPHRLRFPYDQPFMLAAWRALYFRPGSFQADPAQDATWNRGAYLVQGLGHCDACHSSRNWAGASQSATDLGGGLIPVLNWYAPALNSEQELGLGSWSQAEVAALLHTRGIEQGGSIWPDGRSGAAKSAISVNRRHQRDDRLPESTAAGSNHAQRARRQSDASRTGSNFGTGGETIYNPLPGLSHG